MAHQRVPRSTSGESIQAVGQRNSLQRKQLADLQRARILSAMFDVATERGAANVTVAHVVERSGVSRRTFYEIFTDRDDCFLAAFEDALSYAAERVLPAYRSEVSWRARIRAALVALLCFMDEEPVIARLLIAESFGGGPKTLLRRRQAIADVTSAIDEGRNQGKTGFTPPPLSGEGVVGGVLAVIHSRLVGADSGGLVELTNPLMSMIVLPYIGAVAARRELERPVPCATPQHESSPLISDPFKDAGMRLTYRTVRVLMAIAECSGASNRVIAELAEITDQGQMSKLLGRLLRAGMISNTGLGPGQGAPNAWTLTVSGRQVVNSIRAHTEDRGLGDLG